MRTRITFGRGAEGITMHAVYGYDGVSDLWRNQTPEQMEEGIEALPNTEYAASMEAAWEHYKRGEEYDDCYEAIAEAGGSPAIVGELLAALEGVLGLSEIACEADWPEMQRARAVLARAKKGGA